MMKNIFGKHQEGRDIGYGEALGDEFIIYTDGRSFWIHCDKAGGTFDKFKTLVEAWDDFRRQIADEFCGEAELTEIDEEFEDLLD